MMKFYRGETFVKFFPHMLTSYQSIEIYFYGFPTVVLIKFFIPLGRLKQLYGKTSSRQGGVPAVQRKDPRKTRQNFIPTM